MLFITVSLNINCIFLGAHVIDMDASLNKRTDQHLYVHGQQCGHLRFSIMMYESECWCLRREDETRILVSDINELA